MFIDNLPVLVGIPPDGIPANPSDPKPTGDFAAYDRCKDAVGVAMAVADFQLSRAGSFDPIHYVIDHKFRRDGGQKCLGLLGLLDGLD